MMDQIDMWIGFVGLNKELLLAMIAVVNFSTDFFKKLFGIPDGRKQVLFLVLAESYFYCITYFYQIGEWSIPTILLSGLTVTVAASGSRELVKTYIKKKNGGG